MDEKDLELEIPDPSDDAVPEDVLDDELPELEPGEATAPSFGDVLGV